MEVAIIRFTENTGRTYIVDITNDVDKWLIDNNKDRDEDDHEELISFDIEWTTLKIYPTLKTMKEKQVLEWYDNFVDYVMQYDNNVYNAACEYADLKEQEQ